MEPRTLAGLFAILFLTCPSPLMGQGGADSTVLRYKPQTELLHYQVTVVTEYRVVAPGLSERWNTTQSIYDDMVLEVREDESGTLSGRYDLGTVRSWTRNPTGQTGGLRELAGGRSNRITRFKMDDTGDVGVMGDRNRALAGTEIFRRLWQVPHVLPEGPVEVGSAWLTGFSVPTTYSHSTEIEATYRVVEVRGEDLWVEFSGSVWEVLARSRSGHVTHGSFTGRFGFRPSLGAMVAVEWDYDYRTGNPDRSWEYTETREEGSFVLRGLEGELPVHGVTPVIQENRNDKKALFIAAGLVVVALGIVFGG
jgi:hypothetical protein